MAPAFGAAVVVLGGTAADLPEVMALVHACIEHMRQHGIDQWDDIYPGLDRFAADVAAGTLHVARDGANHVVGIFTVDGNQDIEYGDVPWTIDAAPVAVVHRLMVAPHAQGSGIARRLMAVAEDVASARGFAVVRLDAFSLNPQALQLYRGLGYHEAGDVVLRKGVFRCFEKSLPPTSPVRG